MLGPIITYELAKTIHESRLKEAEQARLLHSLKTATKDAKAYRTLSENGVLYHLVMSLFVVVLAVGKDKKRRYSKWTSKQ